MALTPGTRLGVYQITAPPGEGGMGQVYRATDTTLGRQVAIKILPDTFASSPERLARFEREARTLASLNHPHIAAIYGFEKSAGMHALVMELVEGEDLSQRIARRPIPLDEALPIAKQIAEALEAAHEQGIIHRDLKPANIKVRADGTVKVLDFGLAKVMEPIGAASEVSQGPTITTPAITQPGMILGTAAYMSPEQARGRAVDKRTDIWAFGCVLYQMLIGHAAFRGDTLSDTLAAFLEREPNLKALPEFTPSSVRRLLRRCLEKDPKRRLPDIADARIEIDEAVLVHRLSLHRLSCTGQTEEDRRHRRRSRHVVRRAVQLDRGLEPRRRILFTPNGDSPLYRVPASGGTPTQVTTLDSASGEVQHSFPFFLPDGRHFLYFVVGLVRLGILATFPPVWGMF